MTLIRRLTALATRRKRQVSLVPLIDVVFILLLFFMLSSQLNLIRDVRMDFPIALEQETPTAIRYLNLQDNTKTFTYDGARYEALGVSSLKALLSANPSTVYVVKSSSGVNVQGLIAFIDDLSSAGVSNVSVLEEPS